MSSSGSRANVVRHASGVFEVLGLIKIRPPGPWWWHAEDFSDPGGAKGAIFRCYDADSRAADGDLQELAYLLAADVTGDSSEPDITRFDQPHAEEFDVVLEHAIRSSMAREGRDMTKWMSSHLGETSLGKGLMTAYIARDQGRERQYFDLRIRIRQSNAVIGGCFDIPRKEELAAPIWQAVQDAAYNSRLP
jgi:hypothetical protein